MSGVIIEPFTSLESAERNFQRINEAIVALQGGSIAIENIEGYENLATKNDLAEGMDEVRAECQYAVGDVHISESEVNPKDKLGYGEWTIISRKRVLVGIDVPPEGDNAYQPDQDFQTPGQEGGEKEHAITVDELPAHDHDQNLIGWQADGNTPNYQNGIKGGGGNDARKTGKAGGDQPMSLMQPYYCVYIWKRTA